MCGATEEHLHKINCHRASAQDRWRNTRRLVHHLVQHRFEHRGHLRNMMAFGQPRGARQEMNFSVEVLQPENQVLFSGAGERVK
jgi:hypothetical protein